METGKSLSSSSPARSTAGSLGLEASSAVSSPRGASSSLHLSFFEEVDVESDEDSPPHSSQYEGLLEVVTRAVAKLNIDWPTEKQAQLQKSKLNECFLCTKPLLPSRSLPFFPILHTEVSSSWKKLFSACLFIPASDYNGNVAGYSAMPPVEKTLPSYLFPWHSIISEVSGPALQAAPNHFIAGGQGVHSSGSGWCGSAHLFGVTGILSRPAKRDRRWQANQVR